jgi:hypothetical protein
LGSGKSITEIKANFLQNTSVGIYFPEDLTIKVSSDGSGWGTLATVPTATGMGVSGPIVQQFKWNGAVDGLPSDTVSTMVYARYVKLSFATTPGWRFIDEVEIWGVNGQVYGSASIPPDDPNLALNLSYNMSKPASTSYPDSGKELTDGIFAGASYSNSGWQGHSGKYKRNVTFDLGAMHSISKINANFLQNTSIGISFPNEVIIRVSDDGISWAKLAVIPTTVGSGVYGPITQRFEWAGKTNGLPEGDPGATKIYTRFVNLEFVVNGWRFIDEVEIYGVQGLAVSASRLNNYAPIVEKYMTPGTHTGGIKNLNLFYNGYYPTGVGDWEKEDFIPYISYVDELNQSQDWFFDGALFLALGTPDGRTFVNAAPPPSNKEDWDWYLDKTFAVGGDLDELNEAVEEVGIDLNDTNNKIKVVLMVPLPDTRQSNFGDVDGDSISENFNPNLVGGTASTANRIKAVDWYIDELMTRWNLKNYSHLTLEGLYWLNETVSTDDEVIIHTREQTHGLDLKFFWIPYFDAAYGRWIDLGFDAVALQPNHYFTSIPSRIEEASNLAKEAGTGIEIEFDARMFTDNNYRQKFIDYLNGGVDYSYMGDDIFKAYYQGNRALFDAAYSTIPANRELYDLMYDFVKDQYVKP